MVWLIYYMTAVNPAIGFMFENVRKINKNFTVLPLSYR